MDRTVIFILNSVEQQRCHKRIREFITNGYEVRVYAFNRKTGIELPKPENYKIKIIGEFNNSLSYFKRIGIIKKGIREVIKETKKIDGLYYLFNLDVASIAYWMIDKPYIYEESDLMHTYLRFIWLRKILDILDKHIIQKSVMTVFTSEGFVKYHFSETRPENTWVIPNKLNPNVLNLPIIPKREIDINNIRFGFVGCIRGETLANISEFIIKNYPSHEMHFYGRYDDCNEYLFAPMKAYKNCYFHGPFNNPSDLPSIYANIDILISTYDVRYENIRYAEPNKIYEAIYFETPIIVSNGTYLHEKVKQFGVGYGVDGMNTNECASFISSLSIDRIQSCENAAKKIMKKDVLNDNKNFFKKLEDIL